MRGHFRAAFLVVVSVLCAGPAEAAWGEAEAAAAARLARAFVRPEPATGRVQTPGLSVAVSLNGEIIFAEGFGEALPGVAVAKDTIFQIGSLTKQFTAAAVLDLMSRGTLTPTGERLGLETHVETIIPGAAAWRLEEGDPITVRHLLTMTTNLPNFTRKPPVETDPWGSILAPRLLDALTHVKPSGGPPSFEYSNTSYFLLAEIVERIGGGYREALRSLWAKAGLASTGFQDESAIGKRLAAPTYKRRPAFLEGDWLKGSADVSSTVLDLQIWNSRLINGEILSDGARREMLSEQARVDVHTWYGMGWFVREKDGIIFYTHSGSLPGYTDFNLIARKRSGDWASATILTNSYGVTGLDEFAATLAEMAFTSAITKR